MRRWALACLLVVLSVPSLLCAGLFFWGTRPSRWTVQDVPVDRQGQMIWKASLADAKQGRAWLRAMLMEEAWWGPVDVWVESLPEDFRFPLPAKVKVIGALRVRHPAAETQTRLWLAFPAEEAVLQDFRRMLRERGWKEPWWARLIYILEARRPTPRGFVSSPKGSAEPLTRLYCGDGGRLMQLRMTRRAEDGPLEATLVFVQTGEARASLMQLPCTWKATLRMFIRWGRLVFGFGEALLGMVPIPELPPPPGAHQAATPFGPWKHDGYPTDGYLAYAWLWREGGEPLDVAEVMEHYATVLYEQGWRFEGQEALGDGLRARWTRSLLGRPWVLRLAVAPMDGGRVTAWMSLAPRGQEGPRALQDVPEPRVMEVRIHGSVSPEGAQTLLERWWRERLSPGSQVTAYPGPTAPPLPFPRPPGIWLLGAVERKRDVMEPTGRQWWLYTEMGEEEVRSALTQTLRQQGWVSVRPPEPLEGGFVLPRWQRERRWNFGQWCQARQQISLEITLRPDGERGWWVRVQRLPFPSPPSCRSLEMEARALPSRPWAWTPGLELPDDIPASPGVPFGPLPMGSVWIRTQDRARVLAGLHEQLKARDWVLEAQGTGGGITWSLWRWPKGEQDRRFYLVAWEVTPDFTLMLLTFGPSSSAMGLFPGD